VNESRQLSPDTLYQDKIVIQAFQAWIELRGKMDIVDVTKRDIRAYITELNKRQTSNQKKAIFENSINTYLNIIKRFFKFANLTKL